MNTNVFDYKEKKEDEAEENEDAFGDFNDADR